MAPARVTPLDVGAGVERVAMQVLERVRGKRR
jgi:hypothetical protein